MPFAIISISKFKRQTVRIGVLFPFHPVDGSQLLAGSLMAIRDLNALFNEERNVTFKIAVGDSDGSFSNSILASLALTKNAFDGQGVHVFVGAGSNTQSEALAYASRDHDIGMIGYACNASSLSRDVDFPQVSRVYPSSSNEGTALALMLSDYFGYSRVILIHSSDQYGIDGANLFLETAETHHIDVVKSIEVNYYNYDLVPFIDDILLYDVRVFVLIMSDVRQAGQLLLQGTSIGLFDPNTVVLCSGSLRTSLLWSSLGSNSETLSRTMGGIFTISVADNDWKVSQGGITFIQRYRSQPNTVVIHPNGTKECSAETDDDGNFFLYRTASNAYKRSYNCTGHIFSNFAQNGSDIAKYVAYSYDATWAAGLSVLDYAAKYSNNTVPNRISGETLVAQSTSTLSFVGCTGLVKFSGGSNFLDRYGSGDRITGVRYEIGNFHSGNGSSSDFSFNRVGTWTLEFGFQLCGTDSTLQTMITGGCFPIKYSTADNKKPSDRPPPLLREMKQNLRILLYFLATVDSVIIIFFAVILILYRKTRLLRALQPCMMWIILTANIFNAIRIAIAALPASPSVCGGAVWVGHLGTYVFCSVRADCICEVSFLMFSITFFYFTSFLFSLGLINRRVGGESHI